MKRLRDSKGPWILAIAWVMSATVVPPARAIPIITDVVETGGDAEDTDTITAKWTGVTFTNGVDGEPVAGNGADDPYTVGFFEEEAPMFVDRNHQWNGATESLPLPPYLVGGEYIMSGNDNRDNPDYQLEITISEESYVYMLVDDRMGDGNNADPPNYPDWTGDRDGDGFPDMAWLLEEGWEPVRTGHNRFGNPEWPDQVGADEGADGVGPGVAINQWSSIYVKRIPAGTFTIFAPNNNGQNMYGVVVKAVPRTPTLTRSAGDLFGFSLDITDGTQSALNTNSIAITLNGTAVVPQSISKTNDVTRIQYTAPELLPAGSTQTVNVTFSDTATPPLTTNEVFTFVVESYGTLTPDHQVTANTSQPGFIWRVFQNAGNQENTTAKAERTVQGELRGSDGELLPNLADPAAQGAASGPAQEPNPENAFITFEIPGVINLSQIGGESNGNFPDDQQMPGIPGLELTDDGIVAEIVTYIELPAGITVMGINSDDGFHTSAGRVDDPIRRIRLGEFSGGRGAADTTFRVVVQEAGVYPFRTLWEEGGGGANIEWFTVQPDGTKVLVNDTENGGLRAYRAATIPDDAHVAEVWPLPGTTAAPDEPIRIEIVDGSNTVDQNSVVLRLNGSPASPTVNKTGGTTTVVLEPAPLFAANAQQNLELTFNAGGSPVNYLWSYRILDFPTLPVSLRTDVGTGEDRGFRIRTVQTEAGRGNSDAAAEAHLADTSTADNIADLSAAGEGGIFEHEGVINFNELAPSNAGNFTFDNGFEDQLPPGIPGTLFTTDNYTVEILTYLEFPSAGYYRMGVNSDDGFKVTPATGADTNAPVLGIFNGGRGSADTLFGFGVPEAGVYPFRLIWYEGTGDSNAEWFTINENGARFLVNSDDPESIKAYQTRSADPTPGPTLSFTRTATDLTLTYTGTLQSAESVTGPYTDVAGATSPYVVQTTDGTMRFFRTRQ